MMENAVQRQNNSHHVLYIDESGHGGPSSGIGSYWVVAAVLIPMDEKPVVDASVQSTLGNRFRPYAKELKGSNIPHDLLRDSSVEDVASDVAKICDVAGAHSWIAASRYGKNAPLGFPPTNSDPKGIARQLLMERVNGFFKHGFKGADDCIIVWDISDLGELRDFSANVAAFRNAFDLSELCGQLAPAVLGGLSHDWKGLQIADILANYALHHVGSKRMLPDAKKAKSEAFREIFYPRLQANSQGVIEGVGWKIWE